MAKSERRPVRLILSIAITAFSLVFLMGDFCQDVLSIPIIVDYTGDPNMQTVDFSALADVELPDGVNPDADMEIPDLDGDFDVPGDTDIELTVDPDGYALSITHQSVDFTSEDKGVPNLTQYRGNLDGIFIRSVTYEIISNNIPADIPPLEIYVSPRIQGDTESDTSADWDALIASGEIYDLDLPDEGPGDLGLVKLGQTERIWDDVPVAGFPSNEFRLVRQTGNLDYISETILSNFAFEVIILPTERVQVQEDDLDNLPDDLMGQVEIQLHFVVVVAAKP